MKVKLLGTGDSAGIPHIGCDCETCGRHRRQGKQRTRFSILIENDGEKILVDTSPDLRTQFLRENISDIDAVVFTHAHYDHYAGFGSLYRVIWDQIPVYSTPEVIEEIVEERYSYLPFTKSEPVDEFEVFEEANLEFRLVPVHHPPVDSYGIVVKGERKKLVITGDTSLDIPDDALEEMYEPDLLVADAFTPNDVENDFIQNRISDDGYNFASKHMTYEGALELAEKLEARDTVMVHLSHYFREEYDELGEDGDIFVL